ncbi:MAG: HEAT repeat domain-containing protein [Armatimonadota bacterium]
MSELHSMTPHPGPDVAELQTRLRSAAASERLAAAEALGSCGGPAVQVLCAALNDPDEAVRIAAAQSLGRIGSPGIWALAARLESESSETRERAVWALAYCGPAAVPILVDALEAKYGDTRGAAAKTLGTLGQPEVTPHLCRLLEENEPRIRIAVAQALGAVGDERAVRPLLEVLQSGFVGGLSGRRRWLALPLCLVLFGTAAGLLPGLFQKDRGSILSLVALLLVLVEYLRNRTERGSVARAVTGALSAIAERRPSPGMRAVLPDLRRMAADPIQQDAETREASRTAARRIGGLTESLKDLPLPAAASVDDASLPRVGHAPHADADHLPRVR